MQARHGDWVTVEAAAHSLDVDAATIREWCRDRAVESFRDGPTQRFVRLEQVREQIYAIRGRPRPSLATLIAGNLAEKGRPSESRINDLQRLIRQRTAV